MLMHTHKSEEARARCWSCSQPGLLDPSEEDRLLAARLVSEGWRSTSNRYHTVELVVAPSFDDAVTFRDAAPEWLRTGLRDIYDRVVDNAYRNGPGEQMTLTPAQFRAFKQAGGVAA